MKQIYKDRLQKLADFLKAVPRSKFDLAAIVKVKEAHDIGWNERDYDERIECAVNKGIKSLKMPQEGFCGTVACAIGYAPVVFPRTFKYIWNEDGEVNVTKRNDESTDFWDHNDFFGLKLDVYEYLFTPESYHKDHRGPKSVAKRIEQLIKNDGQVSKQTAKRYGLTL